MNVHVCRQVDYVCDVTRTTLGSYTALGLHQSLLFLFSVEDKASPTTNTSQDCMDCSGERERGGERERERQRERGHTHTQSAHGYLVSYTSMSFIFHPHLTLHSFENVSNTVKGYINTWDS